jgi:hypothetical protein
MHTVNDHARMRTFRLALIGVCTAMFASACTKPLPPAPGEKLDEPTRQTTATTEGAESRTLTSQLDWASEALRRNPQLEVLATDTDAGVFTLRMKDTGEIRAVRVTELAAVPIASLLTPTAMTEPSAPEQSHDSAALPAAPAATATTAEARTAPSYTIERNDGQVKVTGPGVSIVSSPAQTITAAERFAAQRAVEPIICEGRRMLHFDNRDILVDGDAIVARDGCELYITNSRIAATGTAVVIRDALVHVSNSTLRGAAASFDAGDGARVILRGSRFDGIPRRSERAIVQDQGGNQWQ